MPETIESSSILCYDETGCDEKPEAPLELSGMLNGKFLQRLEFAPISKNYVEGTSPRGPVVTWISDSKSKNFPSLHLDLACDGLDRVRALPRTRQTLKRVRFEDHRELMAVHWARPCRLCALEEVVVKVFTSPVPRARRLLVAFSSQPSKKVDPLRTSENVVTETGRARLLRIAERLGAPVAMTPSGPVSWFKVSRPDIEALSRNLRLMPVSKSVTDSIPDPDSPLFARTVACAWGYLTHFEECTPAEIDSMWETALLTVA